MSPCSGCVRYYVDVETQESRLSRLEERVKAKSEKISEVAASVEDLNRRLNWLLVVLAGNFGVSFIKLLGH